MTCLYNTYILILIYILIFLIDIMFKSLLLNRHLEILGHWRILLGTNTGQCRYTRGYLESHWKIHFVGNLKETELLYSRTALALIPVSACFVKKII